MLSQVEARWASELLLKENAQALVSGPAKSTNRHQPPPVDISIDIEVSGVVQGSSLSPHGTGTLTSFAPLEDSVVKEAEIFSEEVGGEGGQQQQRTSSQLSPRSQRRHSKKPAVTQLFELEVSGKDDIISIMEWYLLELYLLLRFITICSSALHFHVHVVESPSFISLLADAEKCCISSCQRGPEWEGEGDGGHVAQIPGHPPCEASPEGAGPDVRRSVQTHAELPQGTKGQPSKCQRCWRGGALHSELLP